MEEVLIAKNLTKTFTLSRKQMKISHTTNNQKVAVSDLSFSAYKGEIYGLLGPNGAGKTTTLRMLASLIKPDSGDALIDGVSVVNNPEGVRGKIGFLTSELKLEDFFTPNYLFDYFARLHNMDEETISQRKQELFRRFNIENFKEVKIADLSTGMKQKVSLTISVLHNPEIIIFDEPTNGLDIVVAKTVTDFLLDLKKEGKTIILSTHIFSLVEELCDRVGIIINGKMILSEDLKELTKEKKLEDVFFEIYNEEADR